MSRASGLVLAGAITALVAACGSSEPAAPETPELPALGPAATAAPVTDPPVADAARLRDQLLTSANLPPNFTALPARAETPLGGQSAPTTPAECAKVLTPVGTQRAGALATASVQYTGPNFASIDIDAASYPNDAVAAAFSELQATLRRCTHYSGADATDIAVDYRIGGFPPPKAGDAATAFQVRTTSDGLTLHSSVAIVQVGSVLAQVAVTAPEPVEDGVLSDLTAAQVRRLQGVSGP
ncbi:PknH-like protein [Nocardia tenerifensis]|uniref:PknH-like protein n=1 Tax=Nocardia tenerifensis TaxID=228006 RepID=A0A318JX24_9NOCA|nr:PknH-like protein [Nocardia tenerifensis]